METYQIITLLYYCYQIENKSSNKYGVPDVVSYAINAYKSRTMQFYSLRTAQLHIYILKFKIEKSENVKGSLKVSDQQHIVEKTV